MKSLAIVTALALAAAVAFGQAPAPTLKIDYQFDVTGPNPANFLSFSGPVRYMDSGAAANPESGGKDGLRDPDATSHASKYHSTEFFSHYQYDFAGKKVIPAALRGLFLFAVGVDSQRVSDALAIVKNPDGSILVRYIHRGTAYEFQTDASGVLSFPTKGFKMRQIGTTDNKTISGDFTRSGKDGGVADVDWAKVWNASIPDGKPIGSSAAKTGKPAPDMADPAAAIGYEGGLKFTFDGKVLRISGTLTIMKK